jgi:hypothetical protein
MIRHRTPPSFDEPLFHEYRSTVFIPYVTVVRKTLELENEPVVSLMDSALPHTSYRVRRMLGKSSIIAITFPADAINLFQALHPIFFGALKPAAAGEIDDGSANEAITKVIQASEQIATCASIRRSF